MIKRGVENVTTGIGKVAADFLGFTDAIRFGAISSGFVGALIFASRPIMPITVARMNHMAHPNLMEDNAFRFLTDVASLMVCVGADIVTDAAIVAAPPLGIIAKGLQMGGLALSRGIADTVNGTSIHPHKM